MTMHSMGLTQETKRVWTWGAAIAIGVFAVPNPASAQEEFRLRWAHYLAAGQFLEVEENFANRVEERTDGRVTFDITYSGGLGSGTEVLALTGRGGVDMSAVVPGYYPDQLLYWKASQIPFVFESPRQAIDVMQTSAKEIPAFAEELGELGVHFLFQQPLGSYYLTGTSPDCDTLAGLAGKKIRSYGADIPKMLSTADAVPITLGVPELYEALQRGVLDYAFVPLGNTLAYRLSEVGEYTCGPIHSVAGHMILINKSVWDSMPADIQTIITEEAATAQQEYVTWLEEIDEATISELETAGATIKMFSEAELAKWKAETPDLLQGWVDEMTERGEGEGAEAVAESWRSLTAN